ncbi:MAG: sensor histidine kinase [Jatrophihabitantaceae bacterium]
MWRLRTLASQILLGILGILLATVAVGGGLYIHQTRQVLDQQYEERARITAAIVAEMPQLQLSLANRDPARTIQRLAQSVIASSGATYVVVTDRAGLRYSHPNPALIGQRLEEPVAALDGQDHVGIDHGSLGRSANGKAPIFDSRHQVIGQVSVGILETEVASKLHEQVEAILVYSMIALAIGAAVALLMSRAVKRVTFGLELREITSLLQEREAMLHGIREGVLGFDAHQRLSLINNEARKLLALTGNIVGKSLDELFGPGRLRDLLSGAAPGSDESVITADSLLVVNRREVVLAGRNVGCVVTLRDRTELEALVRRMNAVTGLASALRAQEHEFTNRLHVIAGLLDLGEKEEARDYLALITRDQLASAEDLRARIAPPVVAALLLAKLSVAAERGIVLQISENSQFDAPAELAQILMTVIGNLVDNALDAVSELASQRLVQVELDDADGLRIVVSDNGPGVPADTIERIFTDGYSTKPPRGELRRGIGLALVQRLVQRAGGSISVSSGPHARFEVRLPASPQLVLAATTSLRAGS